MIVSEQVIIDVIEVDSIYPGALSELDEKKVEGYRQKLSDKIEKKGDLYVKAMIDVLGAVVLKNISESIQSKEARTFPVVGCC
jgi:c-di-GMP-related signal transduction protein